MRAMGLDPTLLGKPIVSESKNISGRCSSLSEGYQCARQEGHGGDHVRGRVFWSDAPTATPTQE